MTDQQTWNCSIALEDNWYVLDLEAGTRRASAAAVVDARIAENKQLGQYRDHLVHLLEDAAQWADSVEATFAAMLWEPAGPDLVVGHLTLTIVPQRNPPPPNEDDTPERTAERLARQRSADPGTEPRRSASWTFRRAARPTSGN